MPRARWTPLALGLLCGHCALTGVLAFIGLAGAGAAPLLFGVNVNYVWPPVLLLGLFGFLVWGGRRREDEACAVDPEPPA
jgi:ABC-type Fe3+-siderophore transport system permease subunit